MVEAEDNFRDRVPELIRKMVEEFCQLRTIGEPKGPFGVKNGSRFMVDLAVGQEETLCCLGRVPVIAILPVRRIDRRPILVPIWTEFFSGQGKVIDLISKLAGQIENSGNV